MSAIALLMGRRMMLMRAQLSTIFSASIIPFLVKVKCSYSEPASTQKYGLLQLPLQQQLLHPRILMMAV